ncbi:MAG TPA: hypothetical protein PL037_09835 [Elusimicrobiales bacterium]|nr:hypothetical protein [Elusimicrobiales bacterium]
MRKAAIISVLACAAFQCRGAYASPAGNTTAQILKLGGGAGQTAVGGAYAVFSGDATAMFGNPAGPAFLDRCSAAAGRSLLFESVNYSAVSAACPAGIFGSFGAGW